MKHNSVPEITRLAVVNVRLSLKTSSFMLTSIFKVSGVRILPWCKDSVLSSSSKSQNICLPSGNSSLRRQKENTTEYFGADGYDRKQGYNSAILV